MRHTIEKFTWPLPTLLWLSGKVWSLALSILTPFINSNYKVPKLIKKQHPNHTGKRCSRGKQSFFSTGIVSTKKRVICGIHFSSSHAHCLWLHFRFWSALVWTAGSWLDFLVPVPSLQVSHISGHTKPCFRKMTNHCMPEVLRGLHEIMTEPSLAPCLCTGSTWLRPPSMTSLKGQLLTSCSD